MTAHRPGAHGHTAFQPADEAICIVSAGAQTAVGRSVLAAAAAVRCGISAYAAHPFFVDRRGEPAVVARADWLDASLPLAERIGILAIDAATETLRPLAPQWSRLAQHVRVHIALSTQTLPSSQGHQHVLDRLMASASLRDVARPPEAVLDGHAGGLLALDNACRQLRQHDGLICLVGGADSWLDPERLQALDCADRLHSVNHSWGFTPGEGAGFCLVTTVGTARRLDVMPLATLAGLGIASESKLLGSQDVCIGEGLSAAFRATLDAAAPVAHTYCDFNGEPYRADEYGFAVGRTRSGFLDPGRFTAPARCWGDVGAASAPLLMTLPLAAWTRGYGQGAANLVWCSSATLPHRGAVVLHAHEAPATN